MQLLARFGLIFRGEGYKKGYKKSSIHATRKSVDFMPFDSTRRLSETTIPGKPANRLQIYRPTERGRAWLTK